MNLLNFDIENFNSKKNMFIEASAGTGKTYTIQQIVAKLIAEGSSLEKIVIVTYTEKAAGELKDRIRRKLTEVIETKKLYNKENAPELSKEILAHFEEELNNVDNASISTFHAFCQNVLTEYSYSAVQPLSLSLIDVSEVGDFIKKWIRDEISSDSRFEERYKLNSNFAAELESDLTSAIKSFYLANDGSAVPEIISVDDSEEKLLVKKDIKALFCINGFEENYYQIVQNAGNPDIALFLNEINKCNLPSFYDGRAFSKRWIDKHSEITEAYNYFSALRKNSKLDELTKIDLETIKFKKELLVKLFNLWQKDKSEKKQQTYDDMIRNIREAVVCKNSRLKKNLQEKFTYAIIDEFQDTNQRQWDIFRTIFMEDDQHSIFVVGDPKQSIYSFQQADVYVYKKAIEYIAKTNGQGYRLSANWRSSRTMIEACNKLFSGKFFDPYSGISFDPSVYEKKFESEALYRGSPVKPVWITEELEEDYQQKAFAQIAADQIIDLCSYSEDNPEETNLRVWAKGKNGKAGAYRNVSFSDFAVLAKTKSEMEEIENCLSHSGIPYSRYKDRNLFNGIECSNWISIFNAVRTEEFSGKNRSILSEALFSKFFNVDINQLQNPAFDNPLCPQRQMILKWHFMAVERQWALLLESIFRDTQIETRMSSLEEMNSLSKFRQIGNFAVDFLYKNNCSLDQLIAELRRLNKAEALSDDEGSLVEKYTDFDSVKVMTIHASKGLEFPVVISTGGYVDKPKEAPSVNIFHNKDKHSVLCFSPLGFIPYDMEQCYEYERIFYVAYTRATSLMILPRYEKWKRPQSTRTKFLSKVFDDFVKDAQKYVKVLSAEVFHDDKDRKKMAEKILMKKISAGEKGSEKSQKIENEILAKKIPDLRTYMHSYSSLSHGKVEDNVSMVKEDGTNADKENDVTTATDLSIYDREVIFFETEHTHKIPAVICDKYPAGANIGVAVHEVYEKADFEKFGNLKSLDEALKSEELKSLVKNCLESKSYIIDSADSKNLSAQTISFVWNTLNAYFPEIKGSKIYDNKFFSLKELSWKQRKSEAEFNMNPFEMEWAGNYCNGFIDLMFERIVEGKKVYSILDWKSNKLEDEEYIDDRKLKEVVDSKYSIQRTLYSYCLIKWLKTFYEEIEDEIFENHFGGVYYVLIRGCTAETTNGIYSQTWKSWKELEKSFLEIRNKLIYKTKNKGE